jgi:transcriptional regulator with XRE-family HTH domain
LVFLDNRIQFLLRKRGIDQEQIAKEQGVSDMSVSRVINRKNLKSDRFMKAIANKLEKNHRVVFPEHYLKKKKSKHTTAPIVK